MRALWTLWLALTLFGCAHNGPAVTPQADAGGPCGAEGQQTLIEALRDSPPDKRPGLLEGFIEDCPEESGLVRELMTTHLATSPVEISLPATPQEPPPPFEVAVHIDEQGQISINGGEPFGIDALKARIEGLLRDAGRDPASARILLSAHPTTRYETLVGVMDVGKSAGIKNLLIVVPTPTQATP